MVQYFQQIIMNNIAPLFCADIIPASVAILVSEILDLVSPKGFGMT